MKPELKLIVAGSRSFDDPRTLATWVEHVATHIHPDRTISIVSGMARGADRLAYEYAMQTERLCYEFPAQWDIYGKRAGYLRNEQMGKFADALLAFWDGESRGTKHMIDFMDSLKKPAYLVRF